MLNIRKREDFSKKLPTYQRRMDTLSRLLASQSICVATAVINKKLYIATNELYNMSKKSNGILVSINKTFSYFRQIANQNPCTPDECLKVFQNMFP